MSEEAATETTETISDEQAVADAVKIDRPENVPEKFWNADDSSVRHDDVLKSYNELSGKFGSFTGAPDTYDFSLSEELTANGVELNMDDPLVSQFSEMAKESGMNQEMANKMLNMYVEGQYADSLTGGEAEEARITEEMGLLGNDAQQRIDNINKWVTANMSPEAAKGLEDAATTAEGVKAIEALIAKTRNAPMVTEETASTSSISTEELHKLQFAKDDHGNRKMQTDPEYRKMVNDLYSQKYPGEHNITVG